MSLPKVQNRELLDELKMVKSLYHMGATEIAVGSIRVVFPAPYEPPEKVDPPAVIETPEGTFTFSPRPPGPTPVARARAELDAILEDVIG